MNSPKNERGMNYREYRSLKLDEMRIGNITGSKIKVFSVLLERLMYEKI